MTPEEAMNDMLDVGFSATLSRGNSCTCDACHAVTKVIILKLPTTKYFDGNTLSTKRREYWLCSACLAKHETAICHPKEEEE